MLRPLITLGAVVAIALSSIATAAAQRGGGGGRGGGPGGPAGFGGPGVGGFGGPGVGGFGMGGRGGFGFGGIGWANGFWYGGYGAMPYGMWNVPMSSRNPAYVVPATADTTQYGLQITKIFDGAAKKANLKVGDVILGIGKSRVESFEALQTALVGAKDVDIVFVNHENGQVEKLPVKVDNNKIGVEVEPVALR